MGATKLTLTVKEESLSLVKKDAKRQHTSVSKLVQRLFDDIAEKERIHPDRTLEKYKDIEMPQWIKNLTGVAQCDPHINYDDVKYEYLRKKYGL